MNHMIERTVMAVLLVVSTAGCVSADRYRSLEARYEHALDAKLDMDRDYAESRRELLAVQEQHAKLAGDIAALNDAVQAKIQAAVGPLAAEVTKLQAERTTALRDRARDETTREEQRRLLIERLDRLSADLDRLADRLTRIEVVSFTPQPSEAKKTKTKSTGTDTARPHQEPSSSDKQAAPSAVPPSPLGAVAPRTDAGIAVMP